MSNATIIIFPDQLVEPIRIVSRIGDDTSVEHFARLPQVRTGEYANDIPKARRYEISSEATEHQADVVGRRFFVDEQHATTTPGGQRLPSWSLNSATLHPDRYDIAAWFQQASVDPIPLWVAHMPIAIRDALRDRETFDGQANTIMVLPDRAVLAASRDHERHPLASVVDTFASQVHVLDQQSHRVGKTLAPLNFTEQGNAPSYAAVVTRAQAVIAEAIVSSHEADPIPDVDGFMDRWREIVHPDHADRLTREDGNTFAVPLAIVDDHRTKGRATIILATLRIRLGTERPDIWMSYHTVYDLNIGRGGSLNFENDIVAAVGTTEADKRRMIRALQDQQLPMLVLSTDRAGRFELRDFGNDLPDATPLLREHPTFTFLQAVLALTLFRQPAAHLPENDVSWRAVFGVGSDDGETDSQGAGTDNKVAEQSQPSEPDEQAPETGIAGEVDPNARATDDGSDTAAGDDGAGDIPQGDDRAGGSDTETDDDGDIKFDTMPEGGETDTGTAVSGDAFDGSGQARLDPSDSDGAEIADAIAASLADDSEPTDDGETDSQGAGTDNKVAEQSQPSEPDEQAPETGIAGEVDPNARATDDGSDTVRSAAAVLTATDQRIIDLLREEVRKFKERQGKKAEFPQVKDKELLLDHEEAMDKVVAKMVELFRESSDRVAKQLILAKQLYGHEDRWPRMLLLLNIVGLLKPRQRVRGQASAQLIETAAKNVLLQCQTTSKVDLKLDDAVKVASSRSMSSGGPNG